MNSFYSHLAGATVRWFDFQGRGDPIVFIHGLGCASSYDYPPVVSNPILNGRRALLIDLPVMVTAINRFSLATELLTRLRSLWSC